MPPARLPMQVVKIQDRLQTLNDLHAQLALFGLSNRPPDGARKPGEESIGTRLQVQAVAEILDGWIDRQFERSWIPELEIFPGMFEARADNLERIKPCHRSEREAESSNH